MATPIITVEGISKQYHIGSRRGYTTFRDAIANAFSEPLRRLRNFGRSSSREADTFWALKDVSFDVAEGEVIGLIGRNGAGKSTLLKILSRVTDPTAGSAVLDGRIGSLLEVGTGFHPELTGRENVYLSGAILGMHRSEIRSKFDQIVEFSGVGKFVDTPVKRYSSGMLVRLGFAVAAHLEPEILLIDEVLAVGDSEFQRKCLGKMSEVAHGHRTVVFVSHNMSAIMNLCHSAVLLDEGRVVYHGTPQGAVEQYLGMIAESRTGFVDLTEHRGRPPAMKPVITSIAMRGNGNDSEYGSVIHTGDDMVLELTYDTGGETLNHAFVGIHTSLGERICSVGTHLDPEFHETLCGKGTLQCRLPEICLTAGDYSLTVCLGNKPGTNVDMVQDAMRFRVELADYFGTGERLLHGQGHIAQRCRFHPLATEEIAPCGARHRVSSAR